MAANKGNSKERKAEILAYLELAGAFGLSPAVMREFARKWNVSERQIRIDVKRIIANFPTPVMKIVANKFIISFERTIADAITLRNNSDPIIKSKGINDYIKVTEAFTRLLENYKFKEKVADKHEMEIKKIEFELIRNKDGNESKN